MSDATMSLTELLTRWLPGSCGQPWTWDDEWSDVRGDPQMPGLVQSIKRHGIREPILLGDDGRVWDGHHRVCIAMDLGLTAVPVAFVDESQWPGPPCAQ